MKRVTAILPLFVACLALACDSKPSGQNNKTINPAARPDGQSTSQPDGQSIPLPVAQPTQQPGQYVAPVSTPPVQQETEQKYWLTIKSGIRHNSSCRYYQNSKGRPCGPDEGRACKICGG
ncbi:MAG: hypothetical protein ABSG53_02450 [Thermoguttaceae bacterium]|jgi:hypothetical protein